MTYTYCNHYTDSYYKVPPKFGNRSEKGYLLIMTLTQIKVIVDVLA